MINLKKFVLYVVFACIFGYGAPNEAATVSVYRQIRLSDYRIVGYGSVGSGYVATTPFVLPFSQSARVYVGDTIELTCELVPGEIFDLTNPYEFYVGALSSSNEKFRLSPVAEITFLNVTGPLLPTSTGRTLNNGTLMALQSLRPDRVQSDGDITFTGIRTTYQLESLACCTDASGTSASFFDLSYVYLIFSGIRMDQNHGGIAFSPGFGGGGGTVPEPDSWTLFILGFGIIGTALRRQNSSSPFRAKNSDLS